MQFFTEVGASKEGFSAFLTSRRKTNKPGFTGLVEHFLRN